MIGLLVWLDVMELVFVAFAVLVASLQMTRRGRFWLRFTLSLLGLVSGLAVLAAAFTLEWLPKSLLIPAWVAVAVGALVLSLRFCYGFTSDSSPGSSEDGYGGALGPDRPVGPNGGLLLADAAQAGARVRDHIRPKLTDLGPRRPPREPSPGPTRDPARSQ